MKSKIENEKEFKGFDLILTIETEEELQTLVDIFGNMGSICKQFTKHKDACEPFNDSKIYEKLRNKQ